MLYEALRGVTPLRELYHTAIYWNACDVIHAPAAEAVLRLLLLTAFAALFYLLCRQTQNRFRSGWITAVVCVPSAGALFLPLLLRDAAGCAFSIPLPLCTTAASAVLLVFYFFTMIAKPDGRHQRSVLLTLLALLAGNAARLYFYNLYQERCMTIDEYTVAGGPLRLAATNGFRSFCSGTLPDWRFCCTACGGTRPTPPSSNPSDLRFLYAVPLFARVGGSAREAAGGVRPEAYCPKGACLLCRHFFKRCGRGAPKTARPSFAPKRRCASCWPHASLTRELLRRES